MTPENHNTEQPAPVGEQQRSSADYFIEYCVNNAHTRRQARAIRQLYAEHHDAFAAYLSLDDINTNSEALAADFDNAYIGTFADEDTLVENELESQGWLEAVDQVIRQQGIPEGILIWDRDALLEQLHRYVYDIVDLDGYLHVFSK